jgi:hypothetical protein
MIINELSELYTQGRLLRYTAFAITLFDILYIFMVLHSVDVKYLYIQAFAYGLMLPSIVSMINIRMMALKVADNTLKLFLTVEGIIADIATAISPLIVIMLHSISPLFGFVCSYLIYFSLVYFLAVRAKNSQPKVTLSVPRKDLFVFLKQRLIKKFTFLKARYLMISTLPALATSSLVFLETYMVAYYKESGHLKQIALTSTTIAIGGILANFLFVSNLKSSRAEVYIAASTLFFIAITLGLVFSFGAFAMTLYIYPLLVLVGATYSPIVVFDYILLKKYLNAHVRGGYLTFHNSYIVLLSTLGLYYAGHVFDGASDNSTFGFTHNYLVLASVLSLFSFIFIFKFNPNNFNIKRWEDQNL